MRQYTLNPYFQNEKMWAISFTVQKLGPLVAIYAICIYLYIDLDLFSIPLCNPLLKHEWHAVIILFEVPYFLGLSFVS